MLQKFLYGEAQQKFHFIIPKLEINYQKTENQRQQFIGI